MQIRKSIGKIQEIPSRITGRLEKNPGGQTALWIITCGLIVRIPFLFRSLTYGSGETWRQADTASIAHHFLLNGFRILYPQINWGGNGPGYVEAEFQLYPFIVALLYRVFGEHLWLGQLVSLLFTVGTLCLFFLLAQKVLQKNAALWSLAFFIVCPLSVRLSAVFMPEPMMMFFYVASIYFFHSWLENLKISRLVTASIMVSIAVLVKGTPIHIGLLFAILAIRRLGWGVLKRLDVWGTTIIALTPSILWYYHAHVLYMTYGNTFGILSGGDNKFGNFSQLLTPNFYIALARLDTIWIFAGVSALVFLVGLIVSFRHRKYDLLLIGTFVIFVYYLIVGRYSAASWAIHYHIFAVPFAALGFGIGVDWLRCRLDVRKTLVVMWVIIATTFLGSGYLYYKMMSDEGNSWGRFLIHCATVVEKVVPANALIVVSTTSQAVEDGIPNNYQEPNIFFYSDRYGWSLPADRHRPELLEEYRNKGAEYFVIYSRELLDANPTLAHYLEANMTQVGPGVEAGCGIYKFGENRKKEMTF